MVYVFRGGITTPYLTSPPKKKTKSKKFAHLLETKHLAPVFLADTPAGFLEAILLPQVPSLKLT